jgi:hypothetical protein
MKAMVGRPLDVLPAGGTGAGLDDLEGGRKLVRQRGIVATMTGP